MPHGFPCVSVNVTSLNLFCGLASRRRMAHVGTKLSQHPRVLSKARPPPPCPRPSAAGLGPLETAEPREKEARTDLARDAGSGGSVEAPPRLVHPGAGLRLPATPPAPSNPPKTTRHRPGYKQTQEAGGQPRQHRPRSDRLSRTAWAAPGPSGRTPGTHHLGGVGHNVPVPATALAGSSLITQATKRPAAVWAGPGDLEVWRWGLCRGHQLRRGHHELGCVLT